jgi:hypothetical protein
MDRDQKSIFSTFLWEKFKTYGNGNVVAPFMILEPVALVSSGNLLEI